ncbi:MAG TPA: 3-hydroxyacyl-ACP dehydratase [Mucilaginibacter sp.]|jgi:predicted hotdog family 3-hydroxylacyl-ACP dehydratase
MEFPVENIIPLIPQKPPFVMVGKLLYLDESSTRSSFHIKSDNIFVKDNIFQEAGLLENIAQTAALGAGYLAKKNDKPVATGYIGAVNNFELFNLPKVDDVLITEVNMETRIFDITVVSGKVWHNENLLAQCQMKVFTRSDESRAQGIGGNRDE